MTANIYPLAPSAQQIADLEALGFTMHEDDATWSAVRELDGYRTSLTLARDWAMASTIRVTGARVVAVKAGLSGDEAVRHAMELALDVDTALLFGDLIRADLRRAA